MGLYTNRVLEFVLKTCLCFTKIVFIFLQILLRVLYTNCVLEFVLKVCLWVSTQIVFVCLQILLKVLYTNCVFEFVLKGVYEIHTFQGVRNDNFLKHN